MIEELKLTKDAAGGSGTKVAELTKSLMEAKEMISKYEIELSELKQTMELRTSNHLKEKSDIRMQLDKALFDL